RVGPTSTPTNKKGVPGESRLAGSRPARRGGRRFAYVRYRNAPRPVICRKLCLASDAVHVDVHDCSPVLYERRDSSYRLPFEKSPITSRHDGTMTRSSRLKRRRAKFASQSCSEMVANYFLAS